MAVEFNIRENFGIFVEQKMLFIALAAFDSQTSKVFWSSNLEFYCMQGFQILIESSMSGYIW